MPGLFLWTPTEGRVSLGWQAGPQAESNGFRSRINHAEPEPNRAMGWDYRVSSLDREVVCRGEHAFVHDSALEVGKADQQLRESQSMG